MVKQRVIPARYIMVVPQKGTRAIHNSKTGVFTGRVVVQGQGDKTKERMLKQDYDINHDGRIGKDEHAGQLIGRTKVRASNRSRAHTRDL